MKRSQHEAVARIHFGAVDDAAFSNQCCLHELAHCCYLDAAVDYDYDVAVVVGAVDALDGVRDHDRVTAFAVLFHQMVLSLLHLIETIRYFFH